MKSSQQKELYPKYGAATHWAKQEVPDSYADKVALRERLRQRFPVDRFNETRKANDPRGVLENDWVVALFGRTAAGEDK
jgi:hypothetical protein